MSAMLAQAGGRETLDLNALAAPIDLRVAIDSFALARGFYHLQMVLGYDFTRYSHDVAVVFTQGSAQTECSQYASDTIHDVRRLKKLCKTRFALALACLMISGFAFVVIVLV